MHSLILSISAHIPFIFMLVSFSLYSSCSLLFQNGERFLYFREFQCGIIISNSPPRLLIYVRLLVFQSISLEPVQKGSDENATAGLRQFGALILQNWKVDKVWFLWFTFLDPTFPVPYQSRLLFCDVMMGCFSNIKYNLFFCFYYRGLPASHCWICSRHSGGHLHRLPFHLLNLLQEHQDAPLQP